MQVKYIEFQPWLHLPFIPGRKFSIQQIVAFNRFARARSRNAEFFAARTRVRGSPYKLRAGIGFWWRAALKTRSRSRYNLLIVNRARALEARRKETSPIFGKPFSASSLSLTCVARHVYALQFSIPIAPPVVSRFSSFFDPAIVAVIFTGLPAINDIPFSRRKL